MNWQEFPGAPVPGTKTGIKGSEIANGSAVCVEIGDFQLLLVRTSGQLKAYVNACPHQYLPLDHRSPNILSADGKILRCSNHAAGFDAETGTGSEGFGTGCALIPVPLKMENDQIVLI